MSAPMWKTAVNEFIKGQNDSASNVVAKELSNGDLKLLELVEHLGDYLTSVDNTARSRGIKLLADVLYQLHDDQLSEKEVELLSQMKNLPDGCSQKICRELLEIGTDFVYGFIQVMDAEKDPRNLPPGELNAISREDLILGLRGCLAASPKFGSYCYPLLLEKMTSDIPSAKLDSFQTLAVCSEVFSSGNPIIEEAALSALTSIVCTLSVKNDQGSPVKGFLTEIMQNTSRQLQQSAIQGLCVVFSFKDLLTPETKLMAINKLLDVAFINKDISEECSDVFTVIANTDVEVLKLTVLPVLVKALRRELMEVDDVAYNYGAVLKYLTSVTIRTDVLQIVIEELLAIIREKTEGLHKCTSDSDLVQIVNCLSAIFKSSVNLPSSLEYLYRTIVPRIYSVLVTMAINNKSSDNIIHSPDILQCFSACIRYMSTAVEHKQLKELCDKITDLYLHENPRSFLQQPDELSVKFQPLKVKSPWQQTQLVSLLTPVICSCPSEVAVSNADKYIEKLSDLSSSSQHIYTQQSACKCLAGLLLDLLESEEVGEQAAHGFNIILTEQDDVMNKNMNANIRIMYKQRIFQENVIRLSSGYQKSDSGTKKNYLIVLSYMLKVLPKQVMLSELPPLFPLLVHSLLCEDTNLQVSTMATMYELTQSAPDIISKHTDSLIPQLLKLCKNPKSMVLVGTCKEINKEEQDNDKLFN
ncbi:hypothetical protein KUTeg_004935 [Tegillarca granosa]|uniref:MMS19 nucleotide excision repair protein n=1 Tax=Tegillarca granosa TaxID=220873 RepID=A0ABQ9FIB3_TEGGR|nr:hypothetical protein KUTeg_004935 [Tegillarca granosa]